MISSLFQWDWSLFQKLYGFATLNTTTEHVFWFLNYAGVAALLLVIAVYIWRHRAWRTGVVIGAAGACAYLISQFIGFMHFRPRPFVAHNFVPLITESPLSKSFPSSHAMTAFAIAFALYLYNKKWGRWALALAAVVAVARVMVGVHFPSDVLAGAVLGVLTSWLVRKLA